MNIRRTSFFVAAALLNIALFATAHAQENANSTPTIKQAQTALDEAQRVLENAQEALKQAQPERAEPKIKSSSRPPEKPKGGGRLYKWVDENGTVSYQNSPPPNNAKVLNSNVLEDTQTGDTQVKELRRASAETESIIDGSTSVMVYTADNCKPCQSVVLFLTQKQVPFIERDIRNDRKARDRLSKLSKQITVPSLFIGDQVVQGNSKPMITRALEKAGYLKPQR